MFTVCVGVYAFYIDLMGKDISFVTVVIVAWGLVSWGIGQFLAGIQFDRRESDVDVEVVSYYNISNSFVCICTFVIGLTVVFSYQYFMTIASSFGGNDFFSAYGAARMYMLSIQEGDMSVEIHKPFVLTLFEMLGSAIAFFYIYVYLYNKEVCNISRPILLLPIICYLPILFFATSRMGFFGIIAGFVGIYTTLRYARLSLAVANRKILKSVMIVILIGATLFDIGGAMRGGAITSEGYTGEKSKTSLDLCGYVASNIYALNYYLEGEQDFDFGAKTLSGVRQILGRFGVEFKERPRHYENVEYKVGAGNVFTGIKEDIGDYTIAFYWVYLIFIGYVCGFFFYSAKSLCYSPHAVFFVILGKLYYPIFIFFYTDDFYSLTGMDFLVPLVLLLMLNTYVKSKYICIHESVDDRATASGSRWFIY